MCVVLIVVLCGFFFFFSSRSRHTRFDCDWSSDVCSSDLMNWGAFYGGHSTDLELTAAWRGGGHIIVSTDLTRTRADLPVGAFTAVLSASRLEYDFNVRSGEGRVGEEGRTRWAPDHLKKKK